jgi:hypothetical protein
MNELAVRHEGVTPFRGRSSYKKLAILREGLAHLFRPFRRRALTEENDLRHCELRSGGALLALDIDELEENAGQSDFVAGRRVGAALGLSMGSALPASAPEDFKPADLYNKVRAESQPISVRQQDQEAELQARERRAKHQAATDAAVRHWQRVAQSKNWDNVVANMEVYRFWGQTFKEDPRRTDEYRDKVLEAVKLELGCVKEGLAPQSSSVLD